MGSWIASGRLVDVILLLTIAEWCGLAVHHHLTGRGIAPLCAGPNLLSGICLLLALRAALLGSGWPWVAVALSGALVAHMADIALRWGR